MISHELSICVKWYPMYVYICHRHCARYSIIFTCVLCVSDRLLLPLRECFSKWCTESMCEQLNIPAEHECFCQSSLELEQAVICWDFLSSWQTNHSMWCSELTNCLLYYSLYCTNCSTLSMHHLLLPWILILHLCHWVSLHCVTEPLVYLYTMWTDTGWLFCAESGSSVITRTIM